MQADAGCDICSASILQEQVRALNDLIDVARASVSTIELDALLKAILESAMRFTGIPAGSVALYDIRTGNLSLRAHSGLSPEFVAHDEWAVTPGGLTDRLLQHDEILFVEDTEQVEFFTNPLAVKEGIRSLICIPLVTKGSIQGVLYLDDFVPRQFDKDRMKLISVLASFAAMAIENAKLHLETFQMAITDGLTGLYNRRYFEQVLPQEMERAGRYDQTFGLLMIDVDNFKNFNDTYGHPMGDRILATIATSIEKSLRSVDFAFRYGGEELVVLLLESGQKNACKVAERIRQRVVRDTNKRMRGLLKEPITVSVGVACYPLDGADVDTLVSKADDLLYQAKSAGKNCVKCHKEENL
jgi:diguanylate cyclase (GGDEF)-like protein